GDLNSADSKSSLAPASETPDKLETKFISDDDCSGGSPFKALSDKGDFSQLASYCEVLLEGKLEATEQIEAKLWWVKSQLELEQMPVSVISAPLDSACDMLLLSSNIHPEKFKRLSLQASELLLALSARLVELNQTKLLPSYLRAAIRLDPMSEVKVRAIFDRVGESFEQDQKKEFLDLFAAKNKSPANRTELDPVNKTAIDIGPKKGLESKTDDMAGSSPRVYTGRQGQLLISLILLICLFGFLFWEFSPQGAQPTLVGASIVSKTPEGLLMETPDASRVAELGKLDAIYYGLSKYQKEETNVAQENRVQEPRYVKNEIQSNVNKVPSASEPQIKKEVVDTNSPLEGTESQFRPAELSVDQVARDNQDRRDPRGFFKSTSKPKNT
ncbi:MAG: hypothetical protein KDD53_12200, partial [Bdellovibrionales bacterium]|nr:hypothetical protein [Bdellovibrionales bacterium]